MTGPRETDATADIDALVERLGEWSNYIKQVGRGSFIARIARLEAQTASDDPLVADLRDAGSALQQAREERDRARGPCAFGDCGKCYACQVFRAERAEAERDALKLVLAAHDKLRTDPEGVARLIDRGNAQAAVTLMAENARLLKALGRLAEAVVTEHASHSTDAPIRECPRAICDRAATARALLSSSREGEGERTLRIYPPWNDEQIRALNRWQSRRDFHPFTCGKNSEHVLTATTNGWVCPSDDYKQNWAHAFMAAWKP